MEEDAIVDSQLISAMCSCRQDLISIADAAILSARCPELEAAERLDIGAIVAPSQIGIVAPNGQPPPILLIILRQLGCPSPPGVRARGFAPPPLGGFALFESSKNLSRYYTWRRRILDSDACCMIGDRRLSWYNWEQRLSHNPDYVVIYALR
jgi:hypothetical protein